MQTNLLRIVVSIYSCLFAAPFSSFAQFNNETTSAPSGNMATMWCAAWQSNERSADGQGAIELEASTGPVTMPSSNAAAASLQRAVACAMEAAFSRPWSMDGNEPTQLENVASSQVQGSAQDQSKPPANNPRAPSLPDLFPPDQTQGNAQDQARLDKRSHMLKIHQRLGLITTIPLLATVISGSFAGGKNASSTNLDLHAALGGVTTGLYFTTAYYAIFAPKIPGTKTRGPIRLHKALAWVHGPGMILTPILGVMAYSQENRGQKVHGIASAHAPVAYATAVAYAAAILSISIKF